MSTLTSKEQMLWDYIDEESNELLLKLERQVQSDGYAEAQPGPLSVDTVVMKIMSAALVKMLALVSEGTPGTDLARAYMDMVPMHVELIKVYTFKAMERELKR